MIPGRLQYSRKAKRSSFFSLMAAEVRLRRDRSLYRSFKYGCKNSVKKPPSIRWSYSSNLIIGLFWDATEMLLCPLLCKVVEGAMGILGEVLWFLKVVASVFIVKIILIPRSQT
jgi:hypothetical protein